MIQDLDKKILAYALSEKRIALQLETTITSDYLCPEARFFYKMFTTCFDKFHELPTIKVMQEQFITTWDSSLETLYGEILSVPYDAREFPSDLEKLKFRYNKELAKKENRLDEYEREKEEEWNDMCFYESMRISELES